VKYNSPHSRNFPPPRPCVAVLLTDRCGAILQSSRRRCPWTTAHRLMPQQ